MQKLRQKEIRLAKFYLVRHGATEWVDLHVLHGSTDIPLNERGRKQAVAAARALAGCGARKLYASSMSRSWQTAEFIGQELELEPVALEGLRELDFGWLEGRAFRDHGAQDYGRFLRQWDHIARRVIRAISGEPVRHFQARVKATWRQILDENPTGSSVVVGHSAVLNVILIQYFWENFPDGKAHYTLHPSSITEVRIATDGQAELVRLNDYSQLPEDLQ